MIYCLSLLIEESKFDNDLGITTKDQKLTKLRLEMQNIVHLIDREKVIDYNARNTITSTVNYLMSNIPNK